MMPAPRILLLLEHRANRELLTEHLNERYEVTSASLKLPQRTALASLLNRSFDLCILDGPTLDRIGEAVQARRELEQPVYLPVVLLTGHRDVELTTRHLWRSIDEVIRVPIERMELQARIETLLHARRLSLELKMRNEDLQSFLHAMTHDLRAPMRAIRGFAQLLENAPGTALDANGRRYLDRIEAASQQMQEILDALLTFARLGRDHIPWQQVDVKQVVGECLHALASTIEEKQAEIEIMEPLPVIWGESFLLKTALMNMLSNALKFTAPGVRPRVHLHAHSQTDIVRIDIEDNGIGIAPAEQSRLFKPFSQLHGVETYPGVGLGLATARKAVELMRGRIGVNSTGGQGSQFWIELPVVPDAIQEEQHALPHC